MEKRPEIIFTTAEYDRHGDHSGLVLFIKEILTEEKEYHPTLFSGVVHSNAGDENWPNRSAKRDNIWDSKNRKARALACHKNAIKEDAVEFLYSFIKREELFWEIVY